MYPKPQYPIKPRSQKDSYSFTGLRITLEQKQTFRNHLAIEHFHFANREGDPKWRRNTYNDITHLVGSGKGG